MFISCSLLDIVCCINEFINVILYLMLKKIVFLLS